MKSKQIITAIMLVSTIYGLSIHAQQGMRLMTPMHETMSKLEELELTGDPDQDFALMILTHHKGGIEMLDEVIRNGSDKEIKDLAERIRKNQEDELQSLGKFTLDHSGTQRNDEFLGEMESHLEEARDEMEKNMKLSGNVDKDFASLMSLHHTHGIKMTRTALKYIKNEELKQIAQKMLAEQQEEKEELEQLKDGAGMGKIRHEQSDSASTSSR